MRDVDFRNSKVGDFVIIKRHWGLPTCEQISKKLKNYFVVGNYKFRYDGCETGTGYDRSYAEPATKEKQDEVRNIHTAYKLQIVIGKIERYKPKDLLPCLPEMETLAKKLEDIKKEQKV
jgi:hypothetical protein